MLARQKTQNLLHRHECVYGNNKIHMRLNEAKKFLEIMYFQRMSVYYQKDRK